MLSPDRLQRLREIEVHARHRALVPEHWGFAGKLPTGQGLSVLFAARQVPARRSQPRC